MMSPLRYHELIISLLLTSFIRALVSLVPGILIAVLLYSFNIFTLGLPLILFVLNLLFFSWCLGFLFCSLLIIYGQSVEHLTWIGLYTLMPFCCVFYPINTLPESLQFLAFLLPPAYAFEGMRQVMADGTINLDYFWIGLALNFLYIAGSIYIFKKAIDFARNKGSLIKVGE